MILLGIIGLSCLSFYSFVLATDSRIIGVQRLISTLFFVFSLPIIAILIGTYLS